jgi:hypothetical protein
VGGDRFVDLWDRGRAAMLAHESSPVRPGPARDASRAALSSVALTQLSSAACRRSGQNVRDGRFSRFEEILDQGAEPDWVDGLVGVPEFG